MVVWVGLSPASVAGEAGEPSEPEQAYPEDAELEDEFTFLQESSVVELAARHRQEIGASPSAITLITREDIETSGATSIPELLQLVPGMEVVTVSAFYTSATARLKRNYDNHNFLVLIDGREANVELFGLTPWIALPLCLEDIERIEVIRGPGSSLYGANALAGVISITTRASDEQTSGWARLIAGEPGTFGAGVRASTRIGQWGVSLGGGVDNSGTFVDPRASGSRDWKLRLVVEQRRSDSERLLVDASLSAGAGEAASVLGTIDFGFTLGTLRLAYESTDLKGHVYWNQVSASANMKRSLWYLGNHLADFVPMTSDGHTVDGEVQWTIPTFFERLMLIVGGRVRSSWLRSDELLDEETFSTTRRPGISHWQMRAGAFVHGELNPVDWATVTGGARVDFNTVTGTFVSPRLVAVFRPADGHSLRLGAARAFRKPSFMETHAHLDVTFPQDSLIQGGDQDLFREFMTRVIGNSKLHDESLLSFEAGYLGRFLDGRFSLALDLYANLYREFVKAVPQIETTLQDLPDLRTSSFRATNLDLKLDILGGELTLRLHPSRSTSLMAAWAHRRVLITEQGATRVDQQSPKNFIILGGRFHTDSGLLGSLFVFLRSEFWDRRVENPAGILEPILEHHIDHVALLLGKLGWRWRPTGMAELEVGLNLSLPVSPFSAPHFRSRDVGGGTTVFGERYGGEELTRRFTVYLEGSF